MAITDREGSDSYIELLRNVDRGELADEMSVLLQKLVTALRDEAARAGTAKGEVNLKLQIAINRSGGAVVAWEASAKPPKRATQPTSYFITGDGRFSALNQKQLDLELKDLGKQLS